MLATLSLAPAYNRPGRAASKHHIDITSKTSASASFDGAPVRLAALLASARANAGQPRRGGAARCTGGGSAGGGAACLAGRRRGGRRRGSPGGAEAGGRRRGSPGGAEARRAAARRAAALLKI
eukprot:tig00000042_g15473.t1